MMGFDVHIYRHQSRVVASHSTKQIQITLQDVHKSLPQGSKSAGRFRVRLVSLESQHLQSTPRETSFLKLTRNRPALFDPYDMHNLYERIESESCCNYTLNTLTLKEFVLSHEIIMECIASIPSSIIHKLHEQTQFQSLLRWEFRIAEYINFNAHHLSTGVLPLWFIIELALLSILCCPLSTNSSLISPLSVLSAMLYLVFYIQCIIKQQRPPVLIHYLLQEMSCFWLKNSFSFHAKLVEQALHQRIQCFRDTELPVPQGVDRVIMSYLHRPQIEQLHIEQAIVSLLREQRLFSTEIIDTIIRFVQEEQKVFFRVCHEMKCTTSACLMGHIRVRNVSSSTALCMRLFVHFGSESCGEPEELAAGCLMEYDWDTKALEDQDIDEFEENETRQSAWDMRL